MKRSISTLLTTLLFSAAMMPNAMAQTQAPGFPTGSSIGAMDPPEQPMSNAPKPTSPKTEVLPAPSASPAPAVSTLNSEKSRPSVDRPSVDSSYPAYCSLPPGAQPDDWQYREALQRCLFGT